MPRSSVSNDGRRHGSDRAGACDENVLAEYGKRKSRVDSIAQWVKEGADIGFDLGCVVPDIRHGQRDVVGKRTWPIDSNTLRVFAEMTTSGQAITASPAHDMAFTTNNVSWKKVDHV
jgi:hypothetical protein